MRRLYRALLPLLRRREALRELRSRGRSESRQWPALLQQTEACLPAELAARLWARVVKETRHSLKAQEHSLEPNTQTRREGGWVRASAQKRSRRVFLPLNCAHCIGRNTDTLEIFRQNAFSCWWMYYDTFGKVNHGTSEMAGGDYLTYALYTRRRKLEHSLSCS